MKRSEINAIIRNAIAFFKDRSFHLPPFAHWTVDDWKSKGSEADGIRHGGLGWDITDYGYNDFRAKGLLLFTIRNGKKGTARNYAEKIMVVEEEQVTPMHFHVEKTEDIINRGGGYLILNIFNADSRGKLANTDVQVSLDGVMHTFKAGATVRLAPGASIAFTPRIYHTFFGQKGGGKVLVGEVSSVNDDTSDNYFLEAVGRFPTIEEDGQPLYPLCTEYPSPTNAHSIPIKGKD